MDKLAAHGFIRMALGSPRVVPAGTKGNEEELVSLFREAAEGGADLLVFPELALPGYTSADLFFQDALLSSVRDSLLRLASQSREYPFVVVVGAPLAVGPVLYNMAVILHGGRILGAVPKTFIPNSSEFYEQRWFASGAYLTATESTLGGQTFPVGTDLLFQAENNCSFCLGIEICEDLWSVTPPSGGLALAGATVIVNCSASNELVGKGDYRRNLVLQQSARCLAAYGYASAGSGESTTDTVYGGHLLAAENGVLVAEGDRFVSGSQLVMADLDVSRLVHERLRSSTYRQNRDLYFSQGGKSYRTILFTQRFPAKERALRRRYEAHPFVPADRHQLESRCAEIFAIQSTGLARRLERSGAKEAVIGLSGGLDSTQALLVTMEACVRSGLGQKAIRALTMPGFGTTDRTLGNVRKFCTLTGIQLETIDICKLSQEQMEALGHSGEPSDTAYENIQARLRTALLMNRANMTGGIVIGTGDLSELALGWCTYNGDHISMYGVNAGVPKTLVRFLVEYVAESRFSGETASVLRDILDTPISPELLPPDPSGAIVQKTEEVIGPYELHDFFLYHAIRCGETPHKVLYLALLSFEGKYDEPVIRKWLVLFYKRFFSQQFKRSCLPDGPKVGSLALSPRADWRMPSDACGDLWSGF